MKQMIINIPVSVEVVALESRAFKPNKTVNNCDEIQVNSAKTPTSMLKAYLHRKIV